MAQGFQGSVNVQPAPAFAGDWAGGNPRAFWVAGPGGLVAGPLGLTISRFAWTIPSAVDQDGAPTIANNFGFGPPTGFIHRNQQGLNTTFLLNASMNLPVGFPVELALAGDLWMKNDGAAQAQIGMKAYASLTTGQVTFAASGAPTQSGTFTGAVAASTFSVTGSIAGNVMNVTAVGSGTVVAGGTISGTGVATGTKVLAQLTGTPGGIGTYAVDIPEQSAASTTISGTYGTLTVTVAAAAPIVLNGVLSGTGVVAGTKLTQFLTGAGGTGTYVVDNNTVVSSTATLNETLNVETKWVVQSPAAAGEIAKVSSWLVG